MKYELETITVNTFFISVMYIGIELIPKLNTAYEILNDFIV